MKAEIRAVGGVIFAAFLLLSASTYAGREYTFPYEKEVSAKGVEKIYIDNAAGEVRLKPALKKDMINIVAEKVVYEEDQQSAQKQAEKMEIEVEKSGKTLRIRTDYSRRDRRGRNFWERVFGSWSCSQCVEYRIFLPEKIEIEISTSSADVFGEELRNNLRLDGSSSDLSLENHRGTVSVEVSSGDLELVNVEGDLNLEGSSSDVYIDHLSGEVFVDNTSGDIKIYKLEGDLVVDNSSGDLLLKESRGKLRVSTSSGDVSVHKHRGAVNISSSSGDVEVELTTVEGKEHYLETSSGDVRLYLPEDIDSWIQVETTSGEIHSRLPLELSSISENRLRGRLGSGAAHMGICTVSGDVGLYKR
ncbi:MAG: hypothetical protein AMJ41_03360 [candidate division Zixibacteria bacterium DG_27]|nr:MAG: hypothetical protein AMJ41_03360 [candidate division Zixibacteria bacterium DG_27]